MHRGRIWDDRDVEGHRLMTQAIALMARSPASVDARGTRRGKSVLAPDADRSEQPGVLGGTGFEPAQTRAMTVAISPTCAAGTAKAALRARDAGFDIVYCYAAHGLTLPDATAVAAAQTTAPTSTGAAWSAGCASCGRSSRTPWMPWAMTAPLPVRLAVDRIARPRRHHPRRGGRGDRRHAGQLPDLAGREHLRTGAMTPPHPASPRKVTRSNTSRS